MNCASCGSQVQQGDSFCMHCGAFLGNPAQSPPDAGTAPLAAAEPWRTASDRGGQAEAGQGAAAAPSAENSPADDDAAWASPAGARASSSGRWLGLLAFLLVLLGLAGAGGYLLQRTVFRGDEDQAGDAAAAQPSSQPPGGRDGPENARRDAQPSVDPNPPDDPSAAGLPADRVSDAPAASGVTASEAVANSGRPDSTGKGGQAPSTPSRQAASSGAGAPQGAATPQPKVPLSSVGQAVKTPPAAKQSTSAAGAMPAAGAAEQPRPDLRLKAEPAANASETANASGVAQPHATSASEATIAAATETAASPPAQGTPRTPVFRPDRQPPPRPAASPQQPGSAGGLQPPAPLQAPDEGIIYWTGRLTKNQVIVIERGKATIGTADGSLPATPVDVWLPSPAVTLVERPTSQNNWSRIAFRCLQSTNRNVTLNIQWKRLR